MDAAAAAARQIEKDKEAVLKMGGMLEKLGEESVEDKAKAAEWLQTAQKAHEDAEAMQRQVG